MVYRDLLELERTIRSLNEKLKDKPEGYTTEFKIESQVFSEMNDHIFEIILLDSKKNMVAYRPHINGSSNNEEWLFGDSEKLVKDAFAWRNKTKKKNNDINSFPPPGQDTIEPEYTLLSFL
jgi:hypothetical protein